MATGRGRRLITERRKGIWMMIISVLIKVYKRKMAAKELYKS